MSEIVIMNKHRKYIKATDLKANELAVKLRNNGGLVPFDKDRIYVAILKAFLAVEGEEISGSESLYKNVKSLVNAVINSIKSKLDDYNIIGQEAIQDIVEDALISKGFNKVGKAYIIYRAERLKKKNTVQNLISEIQSKANLKVILDGDAVALEHTGLNALITRVTEHLEGVDVQDFWHYTKSHLFDEMTYDDLLATFIMTARTKIEQEPNYSFVAARLLLHKIKLEVSNYLKTPYESYKDSFKEFIKVAVEHESISSELQDFDLDMLADAIKIENDMQFSYLGLQTLYDRYFIHIDEHRIESPQIFFMRVAMGLAIRENDKNEKAIEFYNLLSSFDYMSSTPTLFNSGTKRSQLSSCYLLTVEDSLSGIFNSMSDMAQLSKYAGGIGVDFSNVRGINSYIKGTNGKSQGVVPFLKIVNDLAVAVNQGGKRKGAACAYLGIHHRDIEEFLELRKNIGDDRRRTHDMNTSVWIPDLFMKRLYADKDWTLFSSDETPELHDLYGAEYEKKYEEYEKLAAEAKIKNFRTVAAKTIWRKLLSMIFETGHPWITFKDACNIRSPQQHAGVIHSSNLCTEITLNTSNDEIAVCNLGSVNIPQHMLANGEINKKKLAKTIKTAIRMLDNVIDINYYPVEQAKNSNMRHRPVGLGLMGFQDALYIKNISYDSQEAIDFADELMEIISYHAFEESSDLAMERGPYPSFEGSLWSKGVLPIDSIENLDKQRGSEFLNMDRTQRLSWDKLRTKIVKQGMRNSNVLAIAPTATIANICGVTQSIEPSYKNLFVKSNLSGDFTTINTYLVKTLKDLKLWDKAMINDLKYFDGAIENISRIPESVKVIYKTAFNIDPSYLIQAASRRTKWIYQSQSLNVYIAKASGKLLDKIYREIWTRGLKTSYYCRSMGASHSEKSTVEDRALNAVEANSNNNMCSIDNPDCEACQ